MDSASTHQGQARWQSMFRWWGRLLDYSLERIKMREPLFMIGMAIVIGVCCGFGGVGFRWLVDLMHVLFWGEAHISPDTMNTLPVWRLILIPAVGGLIVGPIVYIVVKEARGHGVPEVMAAVATRDGHIRGRVALAKAFSSAVTIGSGGSAGPEGPIIQIGSAIGSKVGQVFGVSRKRLRTFVACGAAAGLAATFNAPIAGSLFAVEVILGTFGVAQFGPIVVSAVVATVISRHYLGGEAVFTVPGYELASWVELGPYMVLGVVCGVVSVVLMRGLFWSENKFERLSRLPAFLKPALGGLMLGAMAWMIPHVYGDGEFVINMILNDQLVWWLLLLLVGAKLVATALTLGSGGSGGVFAPSLFLGAAAGGVVGSGVGVVLGDAAGAPGGYALVGMGGLVAGTIHAPITAIIMIFEITDSYQIILPLMLVCIISMLVSTRLHPESIYTMKLVQQGIDWFKGQSLDVLRDYKVQQLIHADARARVSPDDPVTVLIEKVMEGEDTQFYAVRPSGELVGVVLLHELSRVMTRRGGLDQVLLAEDLCHDETPVCLPDEPLNQALLKFERSGLTELPVVSDMDTRLFLGVLRYREVIAVYNEELMKRDSADGLATRMAVSDRLAQVRIAEGLSMVEWEPPPAMWGRTLADLQLPARYQVRVLLIKRKGESQTDRRIIPVSPGPDTSIMEGDSFIIYGADNDLKRIANL